MGRTKVGNGFSTLEIGGHLVVVVGWLLVGVVRFQLGRLSISCGGFTFG